MNLTTIAREALLARHGKTKLPGHCRGLSLLY